jgi:hypothetical protein
MSKWFEHKQQLFNLDKCYRISHNEYSIEIQMETMILSKTIYFEEEAEKDKVLQQIKKILMESDSETKLPSRCY